jgi:hypothetical protein
VRNALEIALRPNLTIKYGFILAPIGQNSHIAQQGINDGLEAKVRSDRITTIEARPAQSQQ